jgi:hypothetical protein
MLEVVALVTALACSGSLAEGESLDGCQGPPSNAVSISRPTLIFVWPCFALGDTFLEPDPREVERVRDRKMRAQYLRLREELSVGGVEVLEASGALNLSFVNAKGEAERIRTTAVEWRGVLAFCPGQKVKRIAMAQAVVPDEEVLEALRGCYRPPQAPAPK